MGNGPAEGVRVADGRAPALRVADGRAPARGVVDGLMLGVLTVAVGLGEMPGDAEVVTPGDNFGGAGGGDPVQATTDAEATMAAKPTAISLALNRVLRWLCAPSSDSSYLRRIAGRFVPASQPAPEGESQLGLLAACAGGRQVPRKRRRR